MFPGHRSGPASPQPAHRQRGRSFGANKPASTLIGLGEFAIPGMLVEIDAVAVVKRGG